MEYIRTFTQVLDVGTEAELSIEGRAGTITVRGDETDQVRIDVVARLWAEDEMEADEQADLIRRGIRQEGNRVTVRAPAFLRSRPLLFFVHGPRIDYQVTVPQATAASISNRSGRIEIENIAGPVQVEGRSGRVSAQQIGGKTTLSSRSGSVQAEAIAGPLAIESRSGSMRVSHCRGDVTVHGRSGSIQIEDVGGKLIVETRSGSVRYQGDVRDSFNIEVLSGSIRLAVNPDSRFFLDAESASGSVRSDLPLRRSAATAPPGQAPTVRVRTRSGSIHIAPSR